MISKKQIANSNELEFTIFCVENIALRLGVSGEKVFDALTKKSKILYGYVVQEYEMLHTQDKEYIIDDILAVMQEEGVEV